MRLLASRTELFNFSHSRDGFWDLTHARQVFYHWATYPPKLFNFNIDSYRALVEDMELGDK